MGCREDGRMQKAASIVFDDSPASSAVPPQLGSLGICTPYPVETTRSRPSSTPESGSPASVDINSSRVNPSAAAAASHNERIRRPTPRRAWAGLVYIARTRRVDPRVERGCHDPASGCRRRGSRDGSSHRSRRRRRLTRRRSTIVERVLDITVSERRCLVSGDVQHEPSALVTVWNILGKTPLPGAAQPLLWPDLVIRAAVDEHAVSEEQARVDGFLHPEERHGRPTGSVHKPLERAEPVRRVTRWHVPRDLPRVGREEVVAIDDAMVNDDVHGCPSFVS